MTHPEEIPKSEPVKTEKRALYEWLSHPLLLLLVGAIMSSLLIPAFTRRWQDHQKELELKTALVGQINDVATEVTTELLIIEAGANAFRTAAQRQESYNTLYKDFQAKSAIVSSLLQAYFPRTALAGEWRRYVGALDGVVSVTGRPQREERAMYWQIVRDRVSPRAQKTVNWELLASLDDQRYLNEWKILRGELLQDKDELIQRILASQVSGL